MDHRVSKSVLLLMSVGLFFLEASTSFSGQEHVQNTYAKLPLFFIQNVGQLDRNVKYYESGNGHATFFTETGVSLFLRNPESKDSSAQIRLFPLGGKGAPRVVGQGLQVGQAHYFIGNQPEKWRPRVPTYSAVLYEEIYEGVDMRFYGSQRQLEYDVIVKPGAVPSDVTLVYEGVEGLSLTPGGALEISLKHGKLIQKKPYIYQEVNGVRVEIPGKFKLLGRQPVGDLSEHRATNEPDSNSLNASSPSTAYAYLYGFEVGSYQQDLPLVIDPVLIYGTYLGGTNNDFGWAIALDGAGNHYIAGETWSLDFPLFSPVQGSHPGGTRSAFVTKINSTGTALLYSTYLGGSGEDLALGIAVDGAGAAYVTGQTSSSNFPTVLPIQGSTGGGWDAFVTKLDPSGSVIAYSTYLGGIGNDFGRGITVDRAGGAYLTGETLSINFPTTAAIQGTYAGRSDAFVTKINASGMFLDYSTYLGGSASGALGDDLGTSIAVDSTGAAYVAGKTNSLNFPTVSPLQPSPAGDFDVFITKINPAGTALMYASYLGGSRDDAASGVAVDGAGNVYLAGETKSSNFPTVFPIQESLRGNTDLFVTKINAAGSAVVYSTYLGGTRSDVAHGVALDGSNNAYITGWTDSSNFPVVSPLQGSLLGPYDLIAARINAAGTALVYSTYLGSGGSEVGAAIAVDAAGAAYITGWSDSAGFPTVGPVQPTRGGGVDGFVVKITHPAAGPDITVSDTAVPIADLIIPFGDVTIGTFSDQRVTISNDGGINLVLGAIASTNSVAAPFSLLNDNCSGQTLSPSAHCTMDVRFSPVSVVSSNDNFDIPSDDPDENPATVTLSGFGSPVPVPDIAVTDEVAPVTDLNIPFGSITTSSTRTVTIINTGNADLVMGTLAQSDGLSAPFSLLNDQCSGKTVSPSRTCTLNIRFSPTDFSTSNDHFDIPSNDPDENPLIVNVSGTGVPLLVPDLQVRDSMIPDSDRQIPFGNITGGNTSEQTITISNQGDASLFIGQLARSNPLLAPFALFNDLCSGQMIAPAGSCTAGVRFSPLSVLTSNEAFDIPSNDPDEPAIIVNVSGTALQSGQNQAPSEPQLIAPANGAQNVSTSVTFEWRESTDPDGDAVTYTLYYCENPNPLNCAAVQVAHQPASAQIMLAYAGVGLGFFGMVFFARDSPFKRLRRKSGFILAMVFLTGALLISCSSGGGGGSAPSGLRSHAVTNLRFNTQYYWTVVAKDGRGGVTQSDVWTFRSR